MRYSDLTNIAEIENTETQEFELETLSYDCAVTAYADMGHIQVTARYTHENNESDTPQHCSSCDVLLDYDMTDSGLDYVRDEIVKSLSEGNALGLDEDSAVYQWHVAYGDYVKEHLNRYRVGPNVSEILNPADVLQGYLIAQVWTGTISWMTNTAEFGGEEYTSDGLLDRYISAEDLAADIVKRSTEDVDAFIGMIGPYLDYWTSHFELTAARQIGHDFSLTRNHHGAGYWDRGLGELGAWLTRCAQSFGESSLYGYIVLDPEYATRADNGSLEFDLDHVLADTLTVYLEG